MSRLLIVEQGAPGFRQYIIKHLVELEYRLTLLTEFPSVWSQDLFEQIIHTRLRSWPHILQIVETEHARDPFQGVFCYNEGGVPLANLIARQLGLPAVSNFDGETFRYKDRMCVAWETAGVDIPRYRILHDRRDMYFLSSWKYPLVLKPAALMGSNGVIKVERFEELANKIRIPFDADLDLDFGGMIFSLSEVYGLPTTVLAEEYIAGPEYSAEGVTIDGQYILLGITKKFTVDEPFFDEAGHIFPALDIDASHYEVINKVLTKAHQALGICNAFTHAEFRMSDGRPVMMELGARMGGDHIPRLVDYALATDTVGLAARCACGQLQPEEVSLSSFSGHTAPHRIAAIFFISSPPEAYGAIFQGISVPSMEECEILETSLYFKVGDRITSPETWGDTRLGHIMFATADFNTAIEAMDSLAKHIDVAYEGAHKSSAGVSSRSAFGC
ncbi:MAG TPA: ATP-grasp domain-containing protein [Ktedonobacteraceae bacterium]|nr:ATP-grasp domain-containing protein [Ktedonobacteraceae bacterium]